jgi:hypothetical protein
MKLALIIALNIVGGFTLTISMKKYRLFEPQ